MCHHLYISFKKVLPLFTSVVFSSFPPFVTPRFWLKNDYIHPRSISHRPHRPHLLSDLSFLQRHVGHLQGNRCTCWQVDHHLGTRNFDLIRNPQSLKDWGSALTRVSCLLGKKKRCIHLESKPIMFKQKKYWGKFKSLTKKKTWTFHQQRKFQIWRAFNADRATERTPQSPSHVPLSPKKWSESHRKCSFLFFWGGLGGIEYP